MLPPNLFRMMWGRFLETLVTLVTPSATTLGLDLLFGTPSMLKIVIEFETVVLGPSAVLIQRHPEPGRAPMNSELLFSVGKSLMTPYVALVRFLGLALTSVIELLFRREAV